MIYELIVARIHPQTILDPQLTRIILLAFFGLLVLLVAIYAFRKAGKEHEKFKEEEEEIFEQGKRNKIRALKN